MRQYKPTKPAPSLYEYRAKRVVPTRPDTIEFEDVTTVVTIILDTDRTAFLQEFAKSCADNGVSP